MTKLLDLCEATLAANHELKCRVLDLLSLLKNTDKKVVIIPKGSQDAQGRTIEALGIGIHDDFLATNNQVRVLKLDELVAKVLQHLGICSSKMA